VNYRLNIEKILFKTLSPIERKWAKQTAHAFLPSDKSEFLSRGIDCIDIIEYTESAFEAMPAHIAAFLRANLAMVQVAPMIILKRPVFFSSLSDEEQGYVLDKLAYVDVYLLRQGMVLLKLIWGMGMLRDPKINEQIGYQHLAGTKTNKDKVAL
jgi:hypothetical protein